MSKLTTRLELDKATIEITRETINNHTTFHVYALNKTIQEHITVSLERSELFEVWDLIGQVIK